MSLFVELVLVVVALTNLALLASGRLGTTIELSAAQGASLAVLPVLVSGHGIGVVLLLVLVIAFYLKGFLVPKLLIKAAKGAGARHEVDPIIGYPASIVSGIVILGGSFWAASRIAAPDPAVPPMILPLALATMLTGLFLIVTRRSALNQVVGYLVMENGIFIFGAALAQEEPFLVFLGVMLDLLVGVFVMGITIFHIGREYDHIDVDDMRELTR